MSWSAMRGGYDVLGAVPLDLHAVARGRRFLAELRDTQSIWEVAAGIEAARKTLAVRGRTSIPI